jgi:hypothetical protein
MRVRQLADRAQRLLAVALATEIGIDNAADLVHAVRKAAHLNPRKQLAGLVVDADETEEVGAADWRIKARPLA